ncbi:MAG: response regulator [Elusimicrobia bacterium]|nr:response regulator [Elusimicrobiota bacterium]
MGNTILIVEDNPIELTVLAGFFRVEGFTVYQAKNCAEAIELAGRHLPDCFLLDYHLGGETTAAPICGFIRSDARLRAKPILILSGDPEQAIRSYEVCKADVFIEKGKRYSEVLALVRRQLHRADWSSGLLKKGDLTLESRRLRLLRPKYPPIPLSPEQFRFFAALFEKSPAFVREAELCEHVFGRCDAECHAALCSLAYRLRARLGRQLARRIKNVRSCGWIYVQPRVRAGRTRACSPEMA